MKKNETRELSVVALWGKVKSLDCDFKIFFIAKIGERCQESIIFGVSILTWNFRSSMGVIFFIENGEWKDMSNVSVFRHDWR